MLVLSRKKNERIVIAGGIVITVVEVRGDRVRIGIEAPKEVAVHRQEVQEATALLHLSVELPEKLGKGVCIQKIEKFLRSTSIHLCMSLGEAFSNIAMKVRYDDSHTRRPRVYISGPITKGNREDNYDQADEMNRQLIEAGFAPLNPMFSMFSRYAFEIKHSDWMEVDLSWIECADAVIRLPGESVGADMETSHADKLGIPVFKSLEDLKKALEAKASK